jgi:hypothetical protein
MLVRFHCVIAAPLAAVFLCGCVPIPLSEPKVLAGKEVSLEQLEFLTPGVTTKAEVIARLGQPSVVWEDARVMTYDWEMRWGVLVWAVGGYGVGYAGITDIPTHHLLLMEFDDAWRLRRSERVVREERTPYSECLLQWKAGIHPASASVGVSASDGAR